MTSVAAPGFSIHDSTLYVPFTFTLNTVFLAASARIL